MVGELNLVGGKENVGKENKEFEIRVCFFLYHIFLSAKLDPGSPTAIEDAGAPGTLQLEIISPVLDGMQSFHEFG